MHLSLLTQMVFFFFILDGEELKTYEIYYCDTSNSDFIRYHERLQTFVLWYIDGSSFIDTDDANWRFFVW